MPRFSIVDIKPQRLGFIHSISIKLPGDLSKIQRKDYNDLLSYEERVDQSPQCCQFIFHFPKIARRPHCTVDHLIEEAYHPDGEELLHEIGG